MRLAIVMLAATSLFAQDAKTAMPITGNEEAAIIPVKTLTGDSFNRLASMLRVFNVRFQADDQLRTIVVYAPPDVIAKMRKVVEELDKPGSEAAIGRNIEMTLTLLRCTTKPQEGTANLTADLEPVVKQLRAATPYKSIMVWESIPLRLQEGKEMRQTLRLPRTIADESVDVPRGDLRIIPEAVRQKNGEPYVRFSRFDIGLKIPYVTKSIAGHTQFQWMDVGFQTAGDFKQGQKTVVGKLMGSEEEVAIFVVVALKVLD